MGNQELFRCDHCLDVLYCSTECKNDFWKSVHSFECGFGEFFKSIGIAHLSLRILLAASSTFHELKTQLNNLVNPELEDGNVSYKSGDYNSVYNLVTNAGKFDATDLFQYVMVI